MRVRQETFKLVPASLVTSVGPRPPMTSKAAKKAYREATKTPKISRVELRRIQAEERAQERREREVERQKQEKEKAAVRAKAARERAAKKEKEEREIRRRNGEPEKSRFVRASQPTIKIFARTPLGTKRTWQNANAVLEEDAPGAIPEAKQGLEEMKVAKLQVDEEDEFGDFPSLSQFDLPKLLEAGNRHSRKQLFHGNASHDVGKTEGTMLPPRRPIVADIIQPHHDFLPKTPMSITKRATQTKDDQAEASVNSVDTHSSSEESVITKTSHIKKQSTQPRMTSNSVNSNISTSTTPPMAISPDQIFHAARVGSNTITMTGAPRKALREISTNRLPPPLPTKSRLPEPSEKVTSTKLYRSTPHVLPVGPSSTQIFLETHLDDFFPSPSQQVQELLEDIANIPDIPSNTQIACELQSKSTLATGGWHCDSRAEFQDLELHFLSSQDLEISSQDLRDMETPGKPTNYKQVTDCAQVDVDTRKTICTRQLNDKVKPLFFEEKEDDLLQAAIDESLNLAKRQLHSPIKKAGKRKLRRVLSKKSDYGDDEFSFEGVDADFEIFAILEAVESGKM